MLASLISPKYSTKRVAFHMPAPLPAKTINNTTLEYRVYNVPRGTFLWRQQAGKEHFTHCNR